MTSKGCTPVFRRLSVKGISPKQQMSIVYSQETHDFNRCPRTNYRAFTCSSSGAIRTLYLQGSAVAMAVDAARTENRSFSPTTLQEAACWADKVRH